MSLIEFTDRGLYCRRGDFYIDPWRPVDKAILTHGHSDHARWGSKAYLCQTDTKPILEVRLGPGIYQTAGYGEHTFINGVQVSFHPAGHIIGSAQVRVEYGGEVWVVSGDYKVENDGLSGQFESVKCHSFVSECTFGLPVYQWKPQAQIFADIQHWVLKNKAAGKSSILFAYSLGKAQRLLPCLTEVTDRILVHGAVYNVHMALANAGIALPEVHRVTPDTPKEWLKGAVVIAPSSAEGTPWMKRFSPYVVGVCSGWMNIRGAMRRRNADAGFPLSDHADWPGLLSAIKSTEAECVYVTHGFTAAFGRYLNEIGIHSKEVKTEYGDDEAAEKSTELADTIA
ncbi:putative mRNA 3-end processing factor [Cnuella takakiae]|uniref:Putative mRNA 3-end processing factor n=1 Tax=Cnuella takakiae TaxID=1302690 RepID=A0A1M5C5M8_9BACT|nr:ligase-associated DNA damage response exonuclease [Cnuella takakiae]OLY93643.1 DNA ligase-associated DEXH box helicase [Cnuella takakiae]SHF50025.1 putative mRNA 3-end processing factor [Cnuella takakiae]